MHPLQVRQTLRQVARRSCGPRRDDGVAETLGAGHGVGGERLGARGGIDACERLAVRLELPGGHLAVAVRNRQRRHVDRTLAPRQREELFVHRAGPHRMHQHPRAGAHGVLRLPQPGGVYDEGEPDLARLVARGVHQRGHAGRVGRLRWHDVPHLDRRRAPRLVRLHRRPHRGVVRHINELALVGEVEPEVDRREQRAGGHHPRGGGAPGGALLQLERPGIATHIEHGRDAAAQVRAVEALGPSVQLRLDLLVGITVAQVQGVGSPVHPAGLREMHVGVDQARDDPFSGSVHCVGVGRQGTGGA